MITGILEAAVLHVFQKQLKLEADTVFDAINSSDITQYRPLKCNHITSEGWFLFNLVVGAGQIHIMMKNVTARCVHAKEQVRSLVGANLRDKSGLRTGTGGPGVVRPLIIELDLC